MIHTFEQGWPISRALFCCDVAVITLAIISTSTFSLLLFGKFKKIIIIIFRAYNMPRAQTVWVRQGVCVSNQRKCFSGHVQYRASIIIVLKRITMELSTV